MATQATTTTAPLMQPADAQRSAAGLWSDALWRLRRDPTTLAAIAVVVSMVAVALAADVLAANFFHRSFTQQDILSNYEKPNGTEPWMWLLADRDTVVRSLVTIRLLTHSPSGAPVAAPTTSLPENFGGVRNWDYRYAWARDASIGIGAFLALGKVAYVLPFALLLGGLGWLGIANYARGQTIALREREYVVAARTVGSTPVRLMVRHIAPNILPLMIVLAMIEVGQLILIESAISFIGFGIQPPTPSWGNMLTNASQYLGKAPYLIYPPGIAVLVTVLCLYLVGDGLRDALDPRLRGAVGGGARK